MKVKDAGHVVGVAGCHGGDAARVRREDQDVRDGGAWIYRIKMRCTLNLQVHVLLTPTKQKISTTEKL